MLSDTFGDIVVAHDGEGKLDGSSEHQDDENSGALTNAVAFIAGTAVILL